MLLTLPAASYQQESFLAYQKLPPEGTPLLRQPALRGVSPNSGRRESGKGGNIQTGG